MIKKVLRQIINIFSRPLQQEGVNCVKKEDTMPNYFTLKELCYSKTAIEKGIDNTPSWDIVENLKYLCVCLDALREAWQAPIVVTSGYRCAELNKIVGGVAKSHHKLGLAADVQCLDMKKFDEFKAFVANFFKHYDGEFSQVIIEKSGNTQWIHISVADNRRQIFKLEV